MVCSRPHHTVSMQRVIIDLSGNKRPSLSMMQAARGQHCDLVLTWTPQLHVPLMQTHYIRDICKLLRNIEWKWVGQQPTFHAVQGRVRMQLHRTAAEGCDKARVAWVA